MGGRVQTAFLRGLGSQTRGGGEVQRRRRFARDGVWFFICCTQGINSPSTENFQPRDGNVAVILGKRLRSLQAGCSDKLLPAWPTHLAVGWRACGLVIGCLSVFTTWQLASPRVSDPALSKREKEAEVSVFCDLASKVTFHHLCSMLLVTLTNCVAGSEETV